MPSLVERIQATAKYDQAPSPVSGEESRSLKIKFAHTSLILSVFKYQVKTVGLLGYNSKTAFFRGVPKRPELEGRKISPHAGGAISHTVFADHTVDHARTLWTLRQLRLRQLRRLRLQLRLLRHLQVRQTTNTY
jgi:hypothetical protein